MKLLCAGFLFVVVAVLMRYAFFNERYDVRFIARPDTAPSFQRVKQDLEQRIAALPAPALELAELASLVLSEAQRTQSETQYREAEGLADRSLALLSLHNSALLVLAKAAEARHDFPRAKRLAEQSMRERGDVSSHMVLTTIALAQGDLVSALWHGTAAVESEPATATYLNRANVLTAAGRFTEAEFDFVRALRMESGANRAEAAHLRLLWGRHELRKGNLTEARKLIEQGLVAAPENRFGLQLRAEWQLANKDWAGARQSLDASMAQGPMPRDLILMARLFLAKGEAKSGEEYRAQAEGLLRKELKEGRRGHRLELIQALLLGDRPGSTEEALGLLLEEAKVRQTSETFALWSDAFIKQKDWTSARQMGMRAIDAGGRYPSFFERMKLVENALGDGPKAALYASLSKTKP